MKRYIPRIDLLREMAEIAGIPTNQQAVFCHFNPSLHHLLAARPQTAYLPRLASVVLQKSRDLLGDDNGISPR